MTDTMAIFMIQYSLWGVEIIKENHEKIINRDWSDFLSVRQTSMRCTRCMHVYIQHLDCTLKGNKI